MAKSVGVKHADIVFTNNKANLSNNPTTVQMSSAKHLEKGPINVPVASLEVAQQCQTIRLHGLQSSGRSKSYGAIQCFTCDFLIILVVTITTKSVLSILILELLRLTTACGGYMALAPALDLTRLLEVIFLIFPEHCQGGRV